MIREFAEFFKSIRSSAEEHNIFPLHFNTNLMVEEHTNNTALVETYVFYVPLETTKLNTPAETLNNTKITGTSRYSFSLIKDLDNVWKIDDFTMRYKQLVVEKTLEE